MFRLTHSPIDAQSLSASCESPRAGALVVFEGRVRDHNDGRPVVKLEYEAYETLALEEGNRILAESLKRFPVTAAVCVHRVGPLAVGETAVWIGVSAAHRKAAFAACEYIIDEVKTRVPIWKKELYADGDAGWVNAAACGCGKGVIEPCSA